MTVAMQHLSSILSGIRISEKITLARSRKQAELCLQVVDGLPMVDHISARCQLSDYNFCLEKAL